MGMIIRRDRGGPQSVSNGESRTYSAIEVLAWEARVSRRVVQGIYNGEIRTYDRRAGRKSEKTAGRVYDVAFDHVDRLLTVMGKLDSWYEHPLREFYVLADAA